MLSTNKSIPAALTLRFEKVTLTCSVVSSVLNCMLRFFPTLFVSESASAKYPGTLSVNQPLAIIPVVPEAEIL